MSSITPYLDSQVGLQLHFHSVVMCPSSSGAGLQYQYTTGNTCIEAASLQRRGGGGVMQIETHWWDGVMLILQESEAGNDEERALTLHVL